MMRRINWLIGVLSLVLLISTSNSGLRAQNPRVGYTRLDITNQLPSTEVFSIAQDSMGYIWIGARQGLSRFDGYDLENYYHSIHDSNSLSFDAIIDLFVDSKGILWICTENGLNTYQPEKNNFRRYSADEKDSTSLPGNKLFCVREDANKNIWVATSGGLCRYNRDTDNFTRFVSRNHYSLTVDDYEYLKGRLSEEIEMEKIKEVVNVKFSSHLEILDKILSRSGKIQARDAEVITRRATKTDKETSLLSNEIQYLEPDDKGNLWISYMFEGFAFYDPQRNIYRHYRYTHQNHPAQRLYITGILYDMGYLWIITRSEGVYRFDTRDETFRHYTIGDNEHQNRITRDKDGQILLGGNSGMWVYNYSSDSWRQELIWGGEYEELREVVSNIFLDKHGNYWIRKGTDIYLGTPPRPIETFRYRHGHPKSLVAKSLSALEIDSKGEVWLGYSSGGVELRDIHTGKGVAVPLENSSLEGKDRSAVFTIFNDREGRIWAGTFAGGVYKYEPNARALRPIKYTNANAGQNLVDARSIDQDKEGRLWITIHGYGIIVYDPSTGKYQPISKNELHPELTLLSEWTTKIFIDSRERVWVGSIEGISIIDPSNGYYVRNYHLGGQKEFLRFNQVNDIYETPDGLVWVGSDVGLYCFNGDSIGFFSTSDGLPSKTITSIQMDRLGNLWLGTRNGLARIVYDLECFRNRKLDILHFDYTDNLQSNDFVFAVKDITSDGKLLFGGVSGFSIVHPERVKRNMVKPEVILTSLVINNKKIDPSSRENPSPLEKHISFTRKIELKYWQSSITIGFLAINYNQTAKNKYAFYLEGLEKDFGPASFKREATYTGLRPGKYIFRVKAANNDDVWNEVPLELEVIVNPPWWGTKFALVAYFLLAVMAFLLFKYFTLYKHRLMFEAEKMKELSTIKMRFITNLSHEFKTPLSLIYDPLMNVIESDTLKDDPKNANRLRLMLINVRRLMELVNQFIDIRKLDAGKLKLTVQQGDIASRIKSIMQIFEYQAQEKSITFRFAAEPEVCNGWFDADSLQKIVSNILSNAFKHTSSGGIIDVWVREVPSRKYQSPDIEIEVRDTGKGIERKSMTRIFERFGIAEEGFKSTMYQGSGIGLTLVKELVELHHGEIQIESTSAQDNPGDPTGTVVSIRIPSDDKAYDSDEKKVQAVREEQVESTSELEVPVAEYTEEKEQDKAPYNVPLVLLVEDNPDVLKYLEAEISPEYRVATAVNGVEGLKVARKRKPDVIISDIIMPEMDGIEFTRQLRGIPGTAHIPVILLTAKTTEETLEEGFEAGADEFMSKPFNTRKLKQRVKNLIEQRKSLKKHYSKEYNLEPKNVVDTSFEDKFLSKLVQIIEQNISNPELDVEMITREIGMSRAQLYRKLDSLTDHSVKEFVRIIRLKKAAELLVSTGKNVSEVAFEVGFNDLPYFTRCFKAVFSESPSQYAAKRTVKKE